MFVTCNAPNVTQGEDGTAPTQLLVLWEQELEVDVMEMIFFLFLRQLQTTFLCYQHQHLALL
jgi:hypothetical protein